ncbi:MAG: metal ABC transporter permease [Verrucomicrobiota bacterium]
MSATTRAIILGLAALALGAPPVFAERIGDIVTTDPGEQLVKFLTFSDPGVRWTVLAAVLLGAACGLVGSFIVVRKMALLGDAISHAVLPGVALGFAWNMEKDAVAILTGATAAGMIGALTIGAIRRTTKIKEDAALGIVLASFFAIGICALKSIENTGRAGNISGVNHFLFGQAGALNQSDVVVLAIVFALVCLFLAVFCRQLLAASFNGEFAGVLGLPVRWLDNALLLLLTMVIVVSLQAVGVVLVSAMLVTPAATAYLMTDRFHRMLSYAVLFGVIAAWSGALLSFLRTDLPTGPFMALSASAMFCIAYLFAPRQGTILRWLRRLRRERRVREENTLKAIYKVLENRDFDGESVSFEELAQIRREPVETAQTRTEFLVHTGEATVDGDSIHLTPPGLQRAREVVRNHRLWELYLTNEADYAPDHVHDDAEKIEHILGEEAVRALERQLDFPETDPHGKPIPTV